MTRIRTISSEVDLNKTVIRNLKYNLAFDQKEFYFNKGAENFYSTIALDGVEDDEDYIEKNYQFLKKNFLNKNEKISLVSLGCGNSHREKRILEKANNDGFDLNYFGVESSMSMIELSQETLENTQFRSQLIYADFSDDKFRTEFDYIINSSNKKIFAFIGATLGNVPQNYIANTLRNMLNKGDILWLDVRAQMELSNSSANQFFKVFLKKLHDPKQLEFIQFPLKKLNIPLDSGKITLEMIKENPMNTLLFKFAFQLNKEINLKISGEKMTLLKGDSLELINARVYELNSLKEFFEKREFEYKDHFIHNNILQIAFEKQ